MSGTKEGALKTARTNKTKHGEDFYSRIGAMGGKVSVGGGFASNIIDHNGLDGVGRARKFGAVGGRKSRRGKSAR